MLRLAPKEVCPPWEQQVEPQRVADGSSIEHMGITSRKEQPPASHGNAVLVTRGSKSPLEKLYIPMGLLFSYSTRIRSSIWADLRVDDLLVPHLDGRGELT